MSAERNPPIVPTGLYAKLAAAAAEIGFIKRTGTNQSQGYKFAEVSNIVSQARSELLSRGIVIIPKVRSWRIDEPTGGKSSKIAYVEMVYRVRDCDSNDEFECEWVGQGADPGDKAFNKAYTSALKYFLIDLLLIPLGEDPEADPRTDREHGYERAPRVYKGAMVHPASEVQSAALESPPTGTPLATVLEPAPYQPDAVTQAEADTWRRRMTACESAGLVDTKGASAQATAANRRRWLGVALGRKIANAEDVMQITVAEWREINAGLLKRLQDHVPPPGNGAPEAAKPRAGVEAESAPIATAERPPGADPASGGPAPSIADNERARRAFEMALDLAIHEGKIMVEGVAVLAMDPITKSLFATDLLGQVPKSAADWIEARQRIPA